MNEDACMLCGKTHTAGLHVLGCMICFQCEKMLLKSCAARSLNESVRRLSRLFTAVMKDTVA